MRLRLKEMEKKYRLREMDDLVIVFDLAGVIVSSVFQSFINNISKDLKLNIDEFIVELIKGIDKWDCGKISERDCFKKICKILYLDESKWKIYRNKYFSGFKLHKDVINLVNKLRKRYKIGLLSNIAKGDWNHINKRFKLENNFDFLILSFKVGDIKPHKKIYLKLLKETKGKHCIFIDDKLVNLIAAHKFGIIPIHYTGYNFLLKNLRMHGVEI